MKRSYSFRPVAIIRRWPRFSSKVAVIWMNAHAVGLLCMWLRQEITMKSYAYSSNMDAIWTSGIETVFNIFRSPFDDSLSLLSTFCRFQRVDVGDLERKSQEYQTSRSMRLLHQFRRVVLNTMSSQTIGEVSCHWTDPVEWTNTSEESQRIVSSSHTSVFGTTNMAKNSTTAAAHSAERLRRIERDLRCLRRSAAATAAASKLHSIISYQYWRTSVLLVVGWLVIVACCQCFEMFSLSISRTFSQFELNRFRYDSSGTTETKSTDLDDRVGDVGQRTCSIHRYRPCRLQYSGHHLPIHTVANSHLWLSPGSIHYRLWIPS